MREGFVNFWSGLRDWWTGKSKSVRILLLGSLAFILGASLFITMLLGRSDYIVLYNNLTSAEYMEILAKLETAGIAAKVENNSLLVSAEQESAARMQLAVSNYPDSGFGYDTFALGGGLTSTQYQQQRYDTFQLQERIEASIRTFPEIYDAHVTIAMPETSSFVLADDKQPPSVAIKLEKNPGQSVTAEQVQGILNLVRTSVTGLTEDNISIVDEQGDMKYLLGTGGYSSRLTLMEEINETIRRRVLNMLVPIYGESGVRVQVNSELDTSQKSSEVTTYSPIDPENPALQIKDYDESEYQRTTDGTVAQGVPGANDNTNVPQYSAEIADDGTGSYYYNHLINDYLVNSTREQIVKDGYEIVGMSMSILIDADTLPNGQRDQILDLAASASGVLTDNISVQNIRFAQAPAAEPESIISAPNRLWLIIAICLAALMLLIILILAMASRKKKQQQQEDDTDVLVYEESLMDLMDRQEEFEPIQIPETQEQKLRAQIKDLADTDPEIVAQLIKTWLLSA
ncbi:MAG: flagellar M-ring protein FliF [Oscillospiraceae bacterium]|jgi:flagellar M-ring protein FliF|nr:flagellar M-ring protein FliF [Oscillospiraceae bacterium]